MTKKLYSIANTGKHLLLLVALSWLVGGILFAALEGTNFLDSLYWSMTTMSTVGYGDLSPATAAGKMFTIAFQAWSIFVVVPNAVAHVIDNVRQDPDELTNDEWEWHEKCLFLIAKALGITLPEAPKNTNHED